MEDGEQLVGGQLVAAGIGDRLHLLGEVDLEPARQLEMVLGLHQVATPPFPDWELTRMIAS